MNLSKKLKAAVLGWTMLCLNITILWFAYNFFFAPHFGLKSISSNTFVWCAVVYLLQKNMAKMNSDRTDEDLDKLIELGKENIFGKVLAISLMLYLWYSSI